MRSLRVYLFDVHLDVLVLRQVLLERVQHHAVLLHVGRVQAAQVLQTTDAGVVNNTPAMATTTVMAATTMIIMMTHTA